MKISLPNCNNLVQLSKKYELKFSIIVMLFPLNENIFNQYCRLQLFESQFGFIEGAYSRQLLSILTIYTFFVLKNFFSV